MFFLSPQSLDPFPPSPSPFAQKVSALVLSARTLVPLSPFSFRPKAFPTLPLFSFALHPMYPLKSRQQGSSSPISSDAVALIFCVRRSVLEKFQKVVYAMRKPNKLCLRYGFTTKFRRSSTKMFMLCENQANSVYTMEIRERPRTFPNCSRGIRNQTRPERPWVERERGRGERRPWGRMEK